MDEIPPRKREENSNEKVKKSKETQKNVKKQQKKLVDVKWIVTILCITFITSVIFSFAASNALHSVNIIIAFLILLLIVAVGIFFDMIGVAVATATPVQFHAMAAKKVRGSREALALIKNAERVSSVCNDVIGDIAGIISGTTSAAIVSALLVYFNNVNDIVLSLVVTALASALTVGGKAVGKGFAMTYNKEIVFMTAKLISYISFWKKQQ